MTESGLVTNEVPRFRETEPIELWSARLGFHLPYDKFKEVVTQAAGQTGQRYTGFITRDDSNNVTSFTRTRYPRKKYGVSTITECESGMTVLADKLGSSIHHDTTQGFRVVLGLLEGYDADAPVHDINEVRQALPKAIITPAEVFAVRQTETGVSVYGEPVAVIEAPTSMMDDVYDLGDRFKQERFTIENFDQNIAYVVETRFCTEPD